MCTLATVICRGSLHTCFLRFRILAIEPSTPIIETELTEGTELQKDKRRAQRGMVLHAYSPNTGKANPENCRFETSLGYVERPCPKQTNKQVKRHPWGTRVPSPPSCTVSADLSSLAGRARGRLTGRGLSLSLNLPRCLLTDSSTGCPLPLPSSPLLHRAFVS